MAKTPNKSTSPVAGEVSAEETVLQDTGMAGDGQDLNSPDPSSPKGILSREQAIDHVKKNYVVPESVKRMLVTEDGNVFYDENLSSGWNHAMRFNLKAFELNEWSK